MPNWLDFRSCLDKYCIRFFSLQEYREACWSGINKGLESLKASIRIFTVSRWSMRETYKVLTAERWKDLSENAYFESAPQSMKRGTVHQTLKCLFMKCLSSRVWSLSCENLSLLGMFDGSNLLFHELILSNK